MMDRRQAIRTAILGIGSATVAPSLFKKLTVDESLAYQLHSIKSNPVRFWKLIQSQFKFEDDILYFNHGSLGASPLTVIEATEVFRRTLESYPSKYMWGGWRDQVEKVREQVATLLNTATDEIALIHNTTEGMNLVAASMDFKAGDEVIVGNHEHRTATSPWLYHQERKGIKIVRPELPLIPNHPNEIFDVYENAVTKRTKMISMVHLTNTNGMILPVKKICQMARDRQILTVIDGAQAMGAIPCDLKEIGCDFYTASGHKWIYSPKGMGILYARSDKQDLLKPFIANRSYKRSGMSKMEDYNTRNLPELLGLGAALTFHSMVDLSTSIERIRVLRQKFIEAIKNESDLIIKTPLHPDLSHQILTVQKEGMGVSDVKKTLFDQHKIEVRGMYSHGLDGIRISFTIYHDESDVEALAAALTQLG